VQKAPEHGLALLRRHTGAISDLRCAASVDHCEADRLGLAAWQVDVARHRRVHVLASPVHLKQRLVARLDRGQPQLDLAEVAVDQAAPGSRVEQPSERLPPRHLLHWRVLGVVAQRDSAAGCQLTAQAPVRIDPPRQGFAEAIRQLLYSGPERVCSQVACDRRIVRLQRLGLARLDALVDLQMSGLGALPGDTGHRAESNVEVAETIGIAGAIIAPPAPAP
jgi:hypothetical protein